MGCLCHSRGQYLPLHKDEWTVPAGLVFAPAAGGPEWPDGKTIRHWRERALLAENLLREKDEAVSELLDVMERQQRENAKLRGDQLRRTFG